MSLDEVIPRALDYASSRMRDGEVASFDGRDNGEWKIVHRHADPTSTEDDSGPLRSSWC
jgi:hypothetical protein